MAKLMIFLDTQRLPIIFATGIVGICFLLAFQSEQDAYAMSYKSYVLNINNQTYRVQYLLSNATITNMELDQSNKELRMNFTAWGDGTLTISMSRELIDSLNQDGNDSPFLVITHRDNDKSESTRLHDVYATETMRSLDISFTPDTKVIEIKGTQVAPEFGSVGLIAIVGMIMLVVSLLSRYNLRASLRKN